MERCSGICITKKRCKKNAIKDSFCWIHSPHQREMIECGICLRDVLKNNKNNERIDCGHVFCKECIYTWIIEKEETANCPMCRNKISMYFISCARNWGLSVGLLLRIKITIYPINVLDNSELVFFFSFFKVIIPCGIIDENFSLMSMLIKDDQECTIIFEKLKEKSTMHTLYIKKNQYITSHFHYFI
jgi:hypothetical protein